MGKALNGKALPSPPQTYALGMWLGQQANGAGASNAAAPEVVAERLVALRNAADQGRVAPEGAFEGGLTGTVHTAWLRDDALAPERHTLAAMLRSKDAVADVVEVVGAADFVRDEHRALFGAIVDLFRRGEPITPTTVAGELAEPGGWLDALGGEGFVAGLASSISSAGHGEYYAEIVHDRARIRRLIEAGERIAGLGRAARGDDAVDVDALVAAAEEEIYALGVPSGSESPISSLEEALDRVERAGSGTGIHALEGVPTGYVDLDALTRGFQPGHLTVVAAEPGIGKSTLALGFARTAALTHGRPSLLISPEMDQAEITMRMISAESRVALDHMRAGSMNDEAWERVARCVPAVSRAPLTIWHSADVTVEKIRRECRSLQRRKGLDLVVIDTVQGLRVLEAGRPGDRQADLAEVARELARLAKELRLPVVVFSRMGRRPGRRGHARPDMRDLEPCLEENADTVILLHREDAYERETPRAGEADLYVAKHRYGPTAVITVAFQAHYSRFVDMQYH
ncbi:replicative DNA helicase [Streptomyces klenkii]